MWVKNCIKTLPFVDGWVKNTAWNTDIQKMQTAEGYPLLLKPPYGTMPSFHLSFLIDE